MAKRQSKLKEVRLGVIGTGNMGSYHAKQANSIPGCRLTAIADHKPETLKQLTDELDNVVGFAEGKDLIKSGLVDAVLIATPHYDHPPLTKLAFKYGLHVLTEKPVAVTAKDADSVNKAYAKVKGKGIIYAAMFQQRTNPTWRKVKQMIDNGELGEIQRVNWIITNWFRTQTYFDSGGWRATWAGEGGGALINQCPHNLDLLQWFVGMPMEITAQIGIGKYHKIEVEDEVTALLKFKNGATGVFITSTGEAPGTNRLEIVGDQGRLVTDGNDIEFLRTVESVKDYCKNSPNSFGGLHHETINITPPNTKQGHNLVTEAFINAILNGTPLIAEATEGIHSLELANAMLMSGLTNQTVKVPTKRSVFAKMLDELKAKSQFVKKTVKTAKVDMNASF